MTEAMEPAKESDIVVLAVGKIIAYDMNFHRLIRRTRQIDLGGHQCLPERHGRKPILYPNLNALHRWRFNPFIPILSLLYNSFWPVICLTCRPGKAIVSWCVRLECISYGYLILLVISCFIPGNTCYFETQSPLVWTPPVYTLISRGEDKTVQLTGGSRSMFFFK